MYIPNNNNMIGMITLAIILIIFIKYYSNILTDKNRMSMSNALRMIKYSGNGFILEGTEDNKKSVFHYNHSIIPNYPPDLNTFPKIKNAVMINISLERDEALFIPAGWWHWVRSEGRCVAISNISMMNRLPSSTEDGLPTNTQIEFRKIDIARKLLSEAENRNPIMNNSSSLNDAIVEKAILHLSSHDYSNYTMGESELGQITSREFVNEFVNKSRPLRIKMDNWNIDDKDLSNSLGDKELSVFASTSRTITSLEKPGWDVQGGIRPAVSIRRCKYKDYLKIIRDGGIHAYVGMSPIDPDAIGYRIPDFWNSAFEGNMGVTTLWASHQEIETGLHYDLTDNILRVISGKKRVLLFPPSEGDNLYPGMMQKHPGNMVFVERV